MQDVLDIVPELAPEEPAHRLEVRRHQRVAGGGGYGNPLERPIDRVVWDVRNGRVSLEGARRDYGVVSKDGETREVDMAATKRLRKAA